MTAKQPMIVLNVKTTREVGNRARLSNIAAARTVGEIVRTCLGPQAMLKMMLSPIGGISITNDGNAVLREIDVTHPIARSIIDLSRTQDEEVGDGTTSVVLLTCEILYHLESFVANGVHPVHLMLALRTALDVGLKRLNEISVKIDPNDDDQVTKILVSTLDTKVSDIWDVKISKMAISAVRSILHDGCNLKKDTFSPQSRDICIKRNIKVEKICGGDFQDSCVLDGIILNKDVTHPSMPRFVKNARIICLGAGLEYKKGESQTTLEFSKSTDFSRALELEESQIELEIKRILEFKPNVLIVEKGLSDYAQQILADNHVTGIRRLRRSDLLRVCKATGATMIARAEELKESDVGFCGEFSIRKLGDEYYTYFVGCKQPRAVSVILRGPSKDVLNEVERCFQDAASVVKNILISPLIVPGGGASEMAVSRAIADSHHTLTGASSLSYQAIGDAMEIIPTILAQNCGSKSVFVLPKLRSSHSNPDDPLSPYWGIDGFTGKLKNMKQTDGIWEPLEVKIQSLKTAIEAVYMILRIDDVVSGASKKK